MNKNAKFFQNLRDKNNLLISFYFLLPVDDSDCSSTNSALSMLGGKDEFCEYEHSDEFFVVRGTMIDFPSDTLKYEDRVQATPYGQFDSDLWSLHLNKELCKIPRGRWKDHYCYNITTKVKIDEDQYIIKSIKEAKLLGQVRLLVVKSN